MILQPNRKYLYDPKVKCSKAIYIINQVWSKDPGVSHISDSGVQITQEENNNIVSTVSELLQSLDKCQYQYLKLTIKINIIISHCEK